MQESVAPTGLKSSPMEDTTRGTVIFHPWTSTSNYLLPVMKAPRHKASHSLFKTLTQTSINNLPQRAQHSLSNNRYTAVITRTGCRMGLNNHTIEAQVLVAHGITIDQASAAHGTTTDQASVARGITVVRASAAHGMVVTTDQVSAGRGITMDRASVDPGTITGQVSVHGATVADGAGKVFETRPDNIAPIWYGRFYFTLSILSACSDHAFAL